MRSATSSSCSLDTGRFCDPHAQHDACALAEPGTACAYFDENMNHGAFTFDNFGWSCIALLQALTFDGWPLPMCKNQANPAARAQLRAALPRLACAYARGSAAKCRAYTRGGSLLGLRLAQTLCAR